MPRLQLGCQAPYLSISGYWPPQGRFDSCHPLMAVQVFVLSLSFRGMGNVVVTPSLQFPTLSTDTEAHEILPPLSHPRDSLPGVSLRRFLFLGPKYFLTESVPGELGRWLRR